MSRYAEAEARDILASYAAHPFNRHAYSGGSVYTNGAWVDAAEAALEGGDYSELQTMLADEERGERTLPRQSDLMYSLAFMRSTYGMSGGAA